MTRDPIYDAAAATCQSRRGHDFRPYAEPTFYQRAFVVICKGLPALIALGVCVYLLVVF